MTNRIFASFPSQPAALVAACLAVVPVSRLHSAAEADQSSVISEAAALSRAITGDGVILPIREVKLGSPVEGVLRKLEVREGEDVKAGQVLAVFYGPIDQLAAERAAKVLERAESEWKSNARLGKERIISEDKARTIKAQYDIARVEADAAQAQIEEKTLRAPWDGQIVRRTGEEGENVTRARELFYLVDYSKVIAQFYFEGTHLADIRVGMPATVTSPLMKGREFSGVVQYVDPVIDGGSGLFRVKVLIENPGREIKPGIPAKVVLGK